MRPLATLLLATALAPLAAAHGTEQHVDEQLVESGEALMLGEFKAAQAGPLVVVPFVDDALTCDTERGAYRIPLGDDAGVAFVTNETTVQALFDLPADHVGYAGFAVDTHDATRALLLMEENAIALHALVGVVTDDDGTGESRTGALGLPYPIPGTAMHDMTSIPVEGGGVLMSHDDSFAGGRWCASAEPGHLAIMLDRSDLPDSLAQGQLAHVVALADSTVVGYLPRPLDGSTRVLQANLYLAREGEDPARVRAALDPAPTLAQLLPIAIAGVGSVWVARR